MKNSVVRFCAGIIVLLCLCQINACKNPTVEDNSLVGNKDDLLNMERSDTFTVQSYTVPEQTLYSYGSTQGVVGSMSDPIFGTTFAGVYAQCLLNNNGVLFDSVPVLDSCVLSMPYKGKYGSFTQPLDLQVYELNQSLDVTNTNYKTNDAFGVNSLPIGTLSSFIPDLTDSVNILGTNYTPQLRIRLTAAFANKLLHGDSIYYTSSSNFITLFKGFYLTTNTSHLGNGMTYLDMYNSNITLYYHNNVSDSLSYSFPINSSAATINHFDHNYAGTQVQTVLNKSTPRNDSILYIQAASGTKVKLEFPFLNVLYKQKIAVNKAELIVTRALDNTGLDTVYHYPEVIILKRIDDNGDGQTLGSFDAAGLSSTTTETLNGITYNHYKLTLTQYMQSLINGSYNNNGFYLTFSSPVRTDRVVLTNYPSSDPNYKIKLKLTYTKLK